MEEEGVVEIVLSKKKKKSSNSNKRVKKMSGHVIRKYVLSRKKRDQVTLDLFAPVLKKKYGEAHAKHLMQEYQGIRAVKWALE